MSTTSIRLPFLHGDGFARASRRIAGAVRKGQDLAVLLVQIHGIERMCATLGHSHTGRLLDQFYAQLCSIARKKDAIERIGDRKFAVLLSGLQNAGHATLAAQKIERLAEQTVSGHIEKSALETCIGVVMCPEQGKDANQLMRSAEIASLDGRRKGESVCFFEERSAQELFADWDLENRLANALESGDLELYYQPKMSLISGDIVAAEALMRWNEPEIGSISPEVFIELAESTGQIVDLTHFAIQNVCSQLGDWKETHPDLNVAVNITPSIAQSPEIVEVLRSACSIWGVRPGSLTLEVTENALMEDPEASHAVLTRVRDLGVRVSIDDFGTGYSSLAYLKEIPADELKIDRSFVMGMLTDEGDHKIVEHSIRIAKSFGLNVVAEGVESTDALEILRVLGCDYAQGFLICEPTPAAEFAEFCEYADTTVAGAAIRKSLGKE